MPRKVKIELKSGCTYEGCISRCMMDGYGRFRWADGSLYEGMFSNNEIKGMGKMKWPDLSWYEGKFLHGRRHGFGTFFLANSNVSYKGEWSFSKRHGKGLIIYNEHQYYDGEWYDNQFNGKGKRVYGCETWYYGNWCMGAREGFGTMCWSNSEYYRGDWLNSLMHGYGKYTWNGRLYSEFVYQLDNSYKGMWKCGKRSGFGTLIFGYANGALYEGQFQDNHKHGEGTIICGNGKIIHNCPLFQYDNPFHQFPNDSSMNRKFVDRIPTDQMVLYPEHYSNNPTCECEDCICDPKYLFQRDRIQYCTQKTINIPIHESVHTIDLSYHLLKLSVKNIIQRDELHQILKRTKISKEKNYSPTPSVHARKSVIHSMKQRPNYLLNISIKVSSPQDERPILLKNPDDIVKEEHFIYNCFTLHLPRLWEIYRFYCNFCNNEYLFDDSKKVVMVRLFLWQMYRDCKISTKISLIKTDMLLAKNKAALVKTIHNPFERIYFWQFLHSLLAVAWDLYGETIDARVFGSSLLASTLHKFLEKDIYLNVNPFKHSGVVLSKYRDVAPIKAMYDFYQNIADPITAKQFIQLFVPSINNTTETVLQNIHRQNPIVISGVNVIVFNSEIYTSRKDALWGNINDDKCNEIKDAEFQNDYASHIHSLGILDVIDSLSVVCPLIYTETLLNIDYKMNFLEFYEVLIECMIRSYDNKFKSYKKSKELKVTESTRISQTKPKTISNNSKKSKSKSNVFNMSPSRLKLRSKSKLFHARSKTSITSRNSVSSRNVSKFIIRNYSTKSVY